jgi:transcriptional regulator with XRE-family HTH domain
MTFAERLRQLRAATGLSVQDLAARSGVQSVTIRAIEHRGVEPRLFTARRLADGLGLDLSAVLAPVETPGGAVKAKNGPAASAQVIGDGLWDAVPPPCCRGGEPH